MGSIGDSPQRSSSPLKRRAEDSDSADAEATNQSDDVDMLIVPDELDQEIIPLRGIDMLRNDAYTPHENASSVRPSTETPIDEQISKVKEMITSHQLEEGSKVYLVSKKWLSRVLSRGSDAKTSDLHTEEIGPIDNSDLILDTLKTFGGEDFVRLHPNLGEESFEYFPPEAWDLVVSWYGVAEGSSEIVRIACNTSEGANPYISYDLYPMVLKLHRLWSATSPMPLPQKMKHDQPDAPVLVASRTEKLLPFLMRAKEALQIERSTKVRLWRLSMVSPAEPVGSQDDAESENTTDWKKLLIDTLTFTKLERGAQREDITEADDVTVMNNYNGNRRLSMSGLFHDESLVFEEEIKTAPTAKGIWLTNYRAQDAPSPPSAPATSKAILSSKRVVPTPVAPVTRSRFDQNFKEIGVANVGNTCYMNSALQCVKSVEELTKYFLSDAALAEVNTENLLGHNGDIARAYHRLIHEFYSKGQGVVRPSFFKNVIGRHASQFSTYGQQDSQEFLGFLLDGLQEDLSRVKKKPYIEKPDSTDEMVSNPELIKEMAAKVWDISKKRDDSVIADLFTGMYKSTLVCPACGKVSITFDPFNNLTLQLIADTFTHDVTFFPLDDHPIEVQVDLNKNASIKALKQFIGERVGVPSERLVLIDQFNCRLYKVFDDLECVSDVISSNDKIQLFELDAVPTNWPVRTPKSPKKLLEEKEDNPLAETMLVPVAHRYVTHRPQRFGKAFTQCLNPFFITLNPVEASDMETIKRKILAKLATFTTYHPLHADDEDENTNSDIVITTGSDADSSGDGKITATSVDGEEDVVDVKVEDSSKAAKASKTQESPFPLKKFNTRRPKFLDRSTFLDSSLQNMFDICYYTEGNEIVPTGWQTTNEDKPLPSISTRDVQLQAELRRETERSETRRSRSTGSSDESEDEQVSKESVTRMTEESSDEDNLDSQFGPRTFGTPAASRFNIARRGPKTYSKKGNKYLDRLSRAESPELEEPAGPLVRLGEGLCLDWTYDAYETVFGGTDPADPKHGVPRYESTETLEDPALSAKKKARSRRKENGLTLDECLDEFERGEILSDNDMWYCPRCKEHQKATKTMELWKTPDILIVHLKRFSSGNHRTKLDHLVKFPIENLDITSRVIETEPGKQEVYDLIAVDDHSGWLSGGHYTACAKSFVDGNWWCYNDDHAAKLQDLRRIVSNQAYLLFYRRRSDAPLGGPRLRDIVTRYDHPDAGSPSPAHASSGEGQRLVAHSSSHGSASASTGVEAALRRDGSPIGTLRLTAGRATSPALPAYRDARPDGDDEPKVADAPAASPPRDEPDEDLLNADGDVSPALSPCPSPGAPISSNVDPATASSQVSVFQHFDGGAGADRMALDDGPATPSNASDADGSDAAARGSEPDLEELQERLHHFESTPLDPTYVAGDEGFVPPAAAHDVDGDEEEGEEEEHDDGGGDDTLDRVIRARQIFGLGGGGDGGDREPAMLTVEVPATDAMDLARDEEDEEAVDIHV